MGLEFSQFQLFMGDSFAKIKDLRCLGGLCDELVSIKDTDYYVDSLSFEDDRFMWLYIRYGKSSPRSDDVYNRKTGNMESNPRSIDQSELKGQFFIVYDSDFMRLYLSNMQKKGFFKELLKRESDKTVEIKSILISIDEFLKKIKIVQEMAFTREQNLINSVEDVFSSQFDCFGLGMPVEARVAAKFNAPLTSKFKEFMKNFSTDNLKYSGLVCIGKDEKDFEFTFNTKTFQQKLNVDAERGENGLFLDSEVRDKIMTQIKSINVREA